jgi:YVTN family beta-propeller protein
MKFIMIAMLCAVAYGQTPTAGTQIAVDTFPMSAVVSPDGKYMLVMTAGLNPPGISVIDLAGARELSRTPVPDAWLGLVMTKAGDKVYVGGGSRAAVFEFSFANGALKAGRTFPLIAEKDRSPQDFAGDVKLAPDGHLLYVANLFRDTVVVMNPQSGLILSRIKTGRRPYRILFHPSGKTMYVSSWADGTIGQYDVNSGERLVNFRVAPHPTDMVWVDGGLSAGAPGDSHPEIKARMFVPAANTNSLYVLGASETGDLTKLETINLALTAQQPLGTTPSAAALSADKKLLYVACSDANDVAVIDISGERNLVAGFMPTGAYPTAVAGLPDGRIGILNGHGNSVQILDPPDDTALNSYTQKVMAGFAYRDPPAEATAGPGGGIAIHPVKHVVYVVRDGNSGAEGVNRATAGIAPDFTVRLAQATLAGRRKVYDYEGQEPANVAPAGYLWTAASQAGLKIRNYGFQVHNLAKPNADGEQVDRVYDPALSASTDMEYRGPDPAYPDTERAKEFATEMKEYGDLGTMPDLLLVRIGNDDPALATITEAVQKSKYWNETAMFVVNDTAARIFSPWKNVASDTTPVSALRTVEALLGLHPMTVFDAAAAPVFEPFAITRTQ